MIRTRAIIKYLGYVLLFNALFLFIATAISFHYQEKCFNALLFSAVLYTTLGILPHIFIEKIESIGFHEGMTISVLGWLIMCLAGMIPYLMWGSEFTPANALFESVSGYTTTGSTILSDIEFQPKGILFWRAATHFIGGVGILLFVLLILPNAQGARSSIYKTEVSGLSMLYFKMHPRQIAKTITLVYISLNIVLTFILWALGMTWFDAICHAFSTIATGGFSTKNLSIAAYNNLWIEITLCIFMLLGGMHFGLLYGTFTGKKSNIFRSKIVRSYLIIILIGILLITAKLNFDSVYGWWESLRNAMFQVISIVTTTGFATVNTAAWPTFTIVILIYFSFQCAMVGSTTGGLKFDRIYLFYKTFLRQIKQIQHPSGVYITKMENTMITPEMEIQTVVYIVIYIVILLISTLVLSAMDIDAMTSFSASFATLGTVGPGFGQVGSLDNFGVLPTAAKYVLSANMFLGRLEIMNIFVLILLISKKEFKIVQ